MARKVIYVIFAIFARKIAFSSFEKHPQTGIFSFPYAVTMLQKHDGTKTPLAMEQDIDLRLAVTRRPNGHILADGPGASGEKQFFTKVILCRKTYSKRFILSLATRLTIFRIFFLHMFEKSKISKF